MTGQPATQVIVQTQRAPIRSATIIDVEIGTSGHESGPPARGAARGIAVTLRPRAQRQGAPEDTTVREATVFAAPLHAVLADTESARPCAQTINAALRTQPGREWTMPKAMTELTGRGRLYCEDDDVVTVHDVLASPAYFTAATYTRASEIAQARTDALIRGIAAGTKLTGMPLSSERTETSRGAVMTLTPATAIAQTVSELAIAMSERKAHIARLRATHARMGTASGRERNTIAIGPRR